MAGVDDDRQVRQRVTGRYGRDVEQVARRGVKALDAPLAEHDVRIAARQDVLGAHQQVDDRGAHAPLEQHRLAGIAHLGQQHKVLHVAGADLDHVGIAFDELDAARVHHLGHDRHAVLVTHVAENLEPLFAHALVGVGAGARLEGSAPQDVGAGGADGAGDRVQPFGVFDGAGAGDHRQVTPADFHASHVDDARLGMCLGAGQLIGGQHADDVYHARDDLKLLGLELRLVADHADDRTIRAAAQMRLQAERLHPLDHMVDLLIGGAGFENDDHGKIPS